MLLAFQVEHPILAASDHNPVRSDTDQAGAEFTGEGVNNRCGELVWTLKKIIG